MPEIINQTDTAKQSYHSEQALVKTINDRVYSWIRIFGNVSRNDIQRSLGITSRQCSSAVWHLMKRNKIMVAGTKEDAVTKHEVETVCINPNPEIVFRKKSDKEKIKEIKDRLSDFDGFMLFTQIERDDFVSYINSLEWNNQLRTKCVNLLIAYDQMKDRISILNEIINQ